MITFLIILMALSLLMLLMAKSEMSRVERKARHEIYWLMCMGGRQFTGEKRIESLNQLEKAEAAWHQNKSLENMQKWQQAKKWHENVVTKAYHQAMETFERVEEEQTRVLGKVE